MSDVDRGAILRIMIKCLVGKDIYIIIIVWITTKVKVKVTDRSMNIQLVESLKVGVFVFV